ncbi:high frequency lysogenization protein HflD [Congregibacter sp.]|uniref:high frequency lysogenization protein HflD n=1 Tax=Congregibacter sp. TaxID=2744308 RepID=UPI003F6C70EC
MSELREQTIALAGVAQAARMVDQISKTGSYPLEFLESSVHSLFVFDLEHAEDIFKGLAGARLGLQNLCALLANQQEVEQRDVVRYFFNILHLERRFAADEQLRNVVRSRLEHANFRAEHFANHVGDVCHSVSGVYQDTFSKLPQRIKVMGSAQHLENSQNADIVRSLLLAGIRSAYLWRQLGGKRWKLALQRKTMLKSAQELSRGLGLV